MENVSNAVKSASVDNNFFRGVSRRKTVPIEEGKRIQDSDVVMTGKVDSKKVSPAEVTPPVAMTQVVQHPANDADTDDDIEIDDNPVNVPPAQVAVAAPPPPPPAAPPVVKPPSTYKPKSNPTPNIGRLDKSISKISNYIRDLLQVDNIFSLIRSNLKDKRPIEHQFYKSIQNCVYHSLMEYTCHIQEEYEWTNHDSGDTEIRMRYRYDHSLPMDQRGNISTLWFFDRVYNDRRISFLQCDEMWDAYNATYKDHLGIQKNWLNYLRSKIQEKGFIDASGANILINKIESNWCSDTHEDDVTLPEEPVQEPATVTSQVVMTAEVSTDDGYSDDSSPVAQYPDDVANYQDYYYEPQSAFAIYDDADTNTLCIRATDGTVVPFYLDLEQIGDYQVPPSIIDPENECNGLWEVLSVFKPDKRFYTSEPEHYLESNDNPHGIRHIVLHLDEDGEKHIMGVYLVDNNISEENLKIANYLVRSIIVGTVVSHLEYSITDTDGIISEEEYENATNDYDADADDVEYEYEDDDVETTEDDSVSEATIAAQNAFKQGVQTGNVDQIEEALETLGVVEAEEDNTENDVASKDVDVAEDAPETFLFEQQSRFGKKAKKKKKK